MASATADTGEKPSGGLSAAVTFACALACGTMVANIYYAQPLIGLIGPDLHLSAGAAGAIVTLTQFGYAGGLLFAVPLADKLENKRLIMASVILTGLAMAAAAAAPSAPTFLAAAMIAGFCAAGVHVVVPFAASLAPAETRGRTIGNVMSGLLAGIMLSRPVASIIAEIGGWRAVFGAAAALMVLTGIMLARALPERRPTSGHSYAGILRSMWHLLLRERPLQRRAAYHGIIFTIFTIFWTAVPLELTHRFGFHQTGIALFALAGAAGALVAPLAGRLGDKGYVRAGTAAAMLLMTAATLGSGWAGAIGSMPLLVLFVLILDGATQLNQVLGQRVIFSLPGEDRGRVNAVYMTVIFLCGGFGGIVATMAYARGGWWGTMGLSAILGLIALAIFSTEYMGGRRLPK